MENGKRAENFGLNPHSKGLSFSRSEENFILTADPINKSIDAKINLTNKLVNNDIKKIRLKKILVNLIYSEGRV